MNIKDLPLRRRTTAWDIENTRRDFHENPSISTMTLSEELQPSKDTVQRRVANLKKAPKVSNLYLVN